MAARRQRRRFTSEFKVKIAIGALRKREPVVDWPGATRRITTRSRRGSDRFLIRVPRRSAPEAGTAMGIRANWSSSSIRRLARVRCNGTGEKTCRLLDGRQASDD